MSDLQKSWLETGIEDDFVFYYVMRDNPDLCLELLQMIFPDLGITRVEPVETQKVIDEAHDAHGVRLDVYTEDSDERAYDIEMQATNKGNLRKRSRYNQSMMDMHQLAKSMDYDKLKKSFVVFICNFDLFKESRYVYSFENRCIEDSNIKLEDEMTKVFINAKGTVGNISNELKSFLRLAAKHEATDDFTRKIQDAIDYVHMNEEVRNAYMTIGMKINEERKEAWAEGLSQGLNQGLSQGIISLIIKKVNKCKTLDEIADEIEEEIKIVQPIYDAIIANPGKGADEIYRILHDNEITI